MFWRCLGGVSEVFDVVSLSRDANEIGIVAVYPNPTMAEVTIEINTEIKERGVVKVLSADGTEVLYKATYGVGHNKLTLDFSQFANGVYFISYQDSQTDSIKKIIKK